MLLRDLKKNRNEQKQKLLSELDKIKSGGPNARQVDERFWQPTADKVGNAIATIRFLPAVAGEEVPWIRIFTHNFQGPTGQWFINNCPTTLNQKCPLCESNSLLWNNPVNQDENQAIVRKRKRKLTYISNIYVISDPANSDNDGKVFLYKYGVKIFDKINGLMFPEFADEAAINPFDFWEGANFRLKVRKVDSYTNYDKSVFASSSPLFENDEEIDEVWKQEKQLAEFVNEKQFKSYDKLKERLNLVLSGQEQESEEETDARPTALATTLSAKKPVVEEDAEDAGEQVKSKPSNGVHQETTETVDEAETEPAEDESEIMSYLQKLSEED